MEGDITLKNIEALKSTSEFKEVYQKGSYASNDFLVLRALKVGSEASRVGISVSKKVGNSVVRHRVIRLIRESYLCYKQDLVPGYNFVVIAKPEASEISLAQLKDALFSLLKQKKLV